MKQPIIFVIDDDQQVLRAIERDLRKQYRKEYRILSAESGEEALAVVKELKLKSEVVALFLSDQRMPGMQGVDFLELAKDYYPEAKRVLLTAYSDTNAAIQAINKVQLDYYLMKPWDPPEEKLYPILQDQLDDWQINFKPDFQGIKLVGFQWSPQSHLIKDFLAGNLIPYQWLDIQTNGKAQELLDLSKLDAKNLPALFFEDGSYLANPDLLSVAAKIGLNVTATANLYDVVIIGAGPAGLAAAVYGASEGLKTLVVERRAPGGQAGTSSKIENYLGFPTGLTGAELTKRAILQATRLGAEFLAPLEVVDIQIKDKYKILVLTDGTQIKTRSIVLTTGVEYMQLPASGIDNFTGAGIYYGAATTEAVAARDEEIYIVGGGNSAGQAAMYLSKFAAKVFILIRGQSLAATMSQYLIDQINNTPTIQVLNRTVVKEAHGDNRLEELILENVDTKECWKVKAHFLFIFIGAKPCNDGIKLDFMTNTKGYIETGRELMKYDNFRKKWKLDREPFPLESCYPGVFAAGDVRSGAMNRIASAVGEGAMAIKLVHEYLAEN
ncbi:fused response regulator/thioredoxin-disulfide reductase [Adhaeribacter arboris]|uniref:Fused response regulator/thioredoxin-disulfide reductase n=1 Tax=Adhaeribacter arboris TaxID=2072846 RepID=A0A2T2YNH5_9BACT|nr:response regulator [Adhaeribacter arboris]PSR57051.1 fused response regulator/thioredoxin-disulfide reductase [Adhaeribacter arboris]